MDPRDRIIWSADVQDEETLSRTLDLMPDLRIIKIDRLFVTDFGLGVIDRLQARGLKVFDDAKLIEIPSKLEALAEKHLKHKPFMLNCMAGCQSTGILQDSNPEVIDGLKRFADSCHQVGTKPCGVTVLTSKTVETVSTEFNGRNIIEQVLYYVEMLLMCGFTDIVCSPRELLAIRAESRFDKLEINTPGVRPAGSAKDDQARYDTPEATSAAGATRLIIGRPLTQGDPAANFQNIVASITSQG